MDANGYEISMRLSGIMRFVAPYVAITLSSNMVLLGENRNDVLGGHKMPPHRRWMVGLDQNPASREYWERFGGPTVSFKHRDGLVIDEDVGEAVTRLSVNDGSADGLVEVLDPRGEWARKQRGEVVDPTEPGRDAKQDGGDLEEYLSYHLSNFISSQGS